MSAKKSTKEFIEQATLIHGNKYNYSKVDYKSTKTNVLIVCSIHGDFNQMPQQHLRGQGCIKCGTEQTAAKKRHTIEAFIEKANIVHNYKFTYDKVVYKNNYTPIIITCPIHGDFIQSPDGHLGGNGCKLCASDKGRFSNEDFITKSKQIHGDLYDYSQVNYINTSTKVSIVCPKHGIFEQTPNGHLRGQGCKKCKNTRGENQVYVWLKNNGFSDFVCEKTFDGCLSAKGRKLRYDFYLPEQNVLIEFDGAQHFEPSAFGRGMSEELQQSNYDRAVLHDQIKTGYAQSNNIRLIRIRFDENVYEKLNDLLLQSF